MQVFRDLLSSKKTWTVLIALMLAGAARFGLQLDEATCAGILGIFAVLVHAQGNADQGKEAAKIAAGPTADPVPAPVPAPAPPPSGFVVVGLLVAIVAAFAILLSACGANARQKTINATYASANIASSELETFANDHERAIIHGATSLEDGKSKLLDFRAKVDKAEKDLSGVYRAIAAAAVINDDVSLTSLTQAASLLMAELRDLGVVK